MQNKDSLQYLQSLKHKYNNRYEDKPYKPRGPEVSQVQPDKRCELEYRNRNYRKRQGRCYEIAALFVLDNNDQQWVLCHGTIYFKGQKYLHAWCTLNEIIYDGVLNECFPISEYIARYHPEDILKYDKLLAAQKLISEGHFGPWL